MKWLVCWWRGHMKHHIRYWWAKLRNDLLRLFWVGTNEAQFVEEVMTDLKRDNGLRDLLDEYESKGE